MRVPLALVVASTLLMSPSPAWGDEVGITLPVASGLRTSFDGEGLPEASRNRMLGLRMMLEFGFDYDEWDDLSELWEKESNWLTGAANPNSSARGIPQAMTSLYPETQTRGWLEDPEQQILWGLEYIESRYGTPSKALEHHDVENWY